mmetsp:Transcript_36465/g.112802  ORF Transcript_36465/g.112802 Transcript_36465/m.112802 type:complete len:163 (+) Transcript_36465:322-810(+)
MAHNTWDSLVDPDDAAEGAAEPKRGLFDSSDDDNEATPAKKQKGWFDSSSDDDSDGERTTDYAPRTPSPPPAPIRVSDIAAAAPPPPFPTALPPGAAVLAQWDGGPMAYPGRVERANVDGTYDLLYDDGDREKSVPAYLVQAVGRGRRAKAHASASTRQSAR